MKTRPSFLLVSLAAVTVATALSAACSGSSAATPAPTIPAPSSRAAGPTPAASSGTAAGTTAGAANPFGQLAGGSGDLITGTVTAASDTSITISTQRGPLRLAVDADTRITRNVPATAADLKPGDNVAVVGQRSESGSVTAVAITVSDEPIERGGQFAARGGGGNSGDGSGGGGFFQRGGGAGGGPGGGGAGPGAGPIFQAGSSDPAQIEQQIQQAVESGRLTAEQAAQLRSRLESGQGPAGSRQGAAGAPGAAQFGAPPVTGTVIEAAEGSLTVDTPDGPVQVQISDATRIQRVDSPSPSELALGTSVSVAAQRGADGVVRATTIVIGDAGGTFRLGGGPAASP
jgi:hypothetical protein